MYEVKYTHLVDPSPQGFPGIARGLTACEATEIHSQEARRMHPPHPAPRSALPTRRGPGKALLSSLATLVLGLALALPGDARADDFFLGVDGAALVIIDKLEFTEHSSIPLGTLYPMTLGALQGDIQQARIRFFSLPDVASAGPERFIFSFDPPPDSPLALGDRVTSFDVEWNTATGHITSEPIPVRLHFLSASGSATADFDLILTTNATLLPRFCNLNVLEFSPIAEPVVDGQLILAGSACAKPGNSGLDDFGIQLQISLELLDGADLGACGDNVDNDGDGLTDLFDPGCSDFSDDSEKSDLLPCDDGIDNDGDGKIDFPVDPECERPDSPTEQSICGDGFVTSNETCDDGNTAGGDCCSATCQLDTSGTACNDGNVCSQVDTCDGEGSCRGSSPLQCSDDLFCNGSEICDPNTGCGSGSPPPLSDGIACTADVCNEQSDSIDHTPVDSLCEDGRFCTGERTCSAALGCQSSPPSLDDGVTCTIDFCSEAADRIEHVPNDALCTDNLVCNGYETCSATLDCQAGTPVNLDDGIACTVDTCTADGVKHTPTHALCDDGLYCTGVEICDAQLGCLAGTPPNSSDDGIACTATVCDEASKSDRQVPDDAACDDGLFCNGAERCFAASGCLPGIPLPIDDLISCTLDSCDETTDTISHTPVDSGCDDGLFCNGSEVCSASLGCQSSGAPPVDDGIDCTNDFCNESSDTIVHQPFHFRCDDGLFCSGVESCQVGVGCTSSAPSGLDDGVACTSDSCDENSQSITHVPLDAACDDGAFCNGAESCHATLGCQIGIAPVTHDGVGCTEDFCDEATDSIGHNPLHALCDDGAFCNGAETCDATLDCQPGAAPATDDGIACTNDACDEQADQIVHTPVSELCGDGQFCNGNELCDPLVGCVAGALPIPSDALDCTNDTCDETLDDFVYTPIDGLCDDSDPCTADRCDAVLGCASDPIPGCGLPDLQVAEVTGTPQARIGERVSASASVSQMSESAPALGPVDVAFFLSTDTDIDSSDDMMIGFCEIEELRGGAVGGCEQSELEIPSELVELAPGEEMLFYWGACADEIGAIDEAQEDNNCAPGSAITVPEPTAWLLQLAALAGLLVRRRAKVGTRGAGPRVAVARHKSRRLDTGAT